MAAEICNETEHPIDGEEFVSLTEYVLGALHVSKNAEVSVIFVDAEAMEELHLKWMDLPGPTDVMSFPMDELRPGTVEDPTEAGLLGDIVICPEVAQQQAQTAGHSTAEEMLLLCTHGLLHLLGFDHAEPEEEKQMFALQRHLLLSFLAQRGKPVHEITPTKH